MIDKRFTLEEFERRGYGTQAARDLADELEKEVEAELHPLMYEKCKAIVEDLNSMGHNLRLYEVGTDLFPPLAPERGFQDDVRPVVDHIRVVGRYQKRRVPVEAEVPIAAVLDPPSHARLLVVARQTTEL